MIAWPKEVVEAVEIPESAKDFLVEHGFPEFCGNPWMEFGIYESDADLVIGQLGECPIIVQEPDGSVVIENSEGYRLHVNKSVIHFGRYLEIWQDSDRVVEARRAMTEIDPDSAGQGESCFWGQVLDYEEWLEGDPVSGNAGQNVTPDA